MAADGFNPEEEREGGKVNSEKGGFNAIIAREMSSSWLLDLITQKYCPF